MPTSKYDELISVVMGVRYQRPSIDLLIRAVNSILQQTYSELEIIICERDSVKEAKNYLLQLSQQEPRIKLIDGSLASSFSEQLNICIENAHGNWIARMDDDDYSHPNRLEKQLNFLKEHEDIAFVGCNSKLMQDGEVIGIQTSPEYPETNDFLFNQPFIHPSVMFRRDALKLVEGYSNIMRCNRCEDFDLFMRLYRNGFRGANLQTPYFTYTLPERGITTRSMSDRVNEMKTRFVCFRECKMFPKAIPYVIKPIVVGFLPKKLLARLKRKRNVKNG